MVSLPAKGTLTNLLDPWGVVRSSVMFGKIGNKEEQDPIADYDWLKKITKYKKKKKGNKEQIWASQQTIIKWKWNEHNLINTGVTKTRNLKEWNRNWRHKTKSQHKQNYNYYIKCFFYVTYLHDAKLYMKSSFPKRDKRQINKKMSSSCHFAVYWTYSLLHQCFMPNRYISLFKMYCKMQFFSKPL